MLCYSSITFFSSQSMKWICWDFQLFCRLLFAWTPCHENKRPSSPTLWNLFLKSFKKSLFYPFGCCNAKEPSIKFKSIFSFYHLPQPPKMQITSLSFHTTGYQKKRCNKNLLLFSSFLCVHTYRNYWLRCLKLTDLLSSKFVGVKVWHDWESFSILKMCVNRK